MIARAIAAVVLSLLMASEVRAQYDTPSFLPPRPGDDIGIYLSDVERADFALQGIWRQGGNLNLGLRLGYIDFERDDGAIVVGAESWGLVARADNDFPVDMAWTLGVGATFNDHTVLEVPLGLTIGRVVQLDALTLQPYGHPRIALFIAPDANDEVRLRGLFDLGVDAVVSDSWKLRVGATLGAIDAVGIGLAYTWTRGAVVR